MLLALAMVPNLNRGLKQVHRETRNNFLAAGQLYRSWPHPNSILCCRINNFRCSTSLWQAKCIEASGISTKGSPGGCDEQNLSGVRSVGGRLLRISAQRTCERATARASNARHNRPTTAGSADSQRDRFRKQVLHGEDREARRQTGPCRCH